MIDHAQLTIPHLSNRLSLFEVLHGYPAKTFFNQDTPSTTTPKEKLNKEEAIKLATYMHEGQKVARDIIEKA